MMRTMKRCVCVLLLAALPLTAQATHVVGAGGYAQIQDALAVAQVGDTVLVQSGTYLPFTMTAGVDIVAPNGANVMAPLQTGPATPTTFLLPVGQSAGVHGLVFQQPDALHPHVVLVNGGQVAFEHCTFSPTHPFESHYTLQCHGADLVLVSCTFSAFNGAVLVDGGSLAATDCAFYGVDPQTTLTPMPAAVWIGNSSAQFSFCRLRGGDSTAIGQRAGTGLLVEGNSSVDLVSCTVTGGDVLSGSAVPSVGLENLGFHPVRHLGSTFVGGWGRITSNWGSWPVRGVGSSGATQPATLLGMGPLPYGLRVGQGYGFLAMSSPNTVVVYGIGFGLAGPSTMPGVEALLRCDPVGTMLLAVGMTDASGYESRAAFLSLPATALGTQIWIHGFAFDGARFQVAAPIGGLVH